MSSERPDKRSSRSNGAAPPNTQNETSVRTIQNTVLPSNSPSSNARFTSSVPTITIQAIEGAAATTVTILAGPLSVKDVATKSSTTPGPSRIASTLETVSTITPSSGVDTSQSLREPALAVAQSLPGINQPQPIMDETAVSSFNMAMERESIFTSSIVSSVTLTKTPAPFEASSTPTLEPVSDFTRSMTSFITMTRSKAMKEQASSTSAAILVSSAAGVAQSILRLSSATSTPSSISRIPTRVPNANAAANAQLEGNSRLPPFTKTVFIIFGVLGLLAILIAFGVILSMRMNRIRLLTIQSPNKKPSKGSTKQNAHQENPQHLQTIR